MTVSGKLKCILIKDVAHLFWWYLVMSQYGRWTLELQVWELQVWPLFEKLANGFMTVLLQKKGQLSIWHHFTWKCVMELVMYQLGLRSCWVKQLKKAFVDCAWLEHRCLCYLVNRRGGHCTFREILDSFTVWVMTVTLWLLLAVHANDLLNGKCK